MAERNGRIKSVIGKDIAEIVMKEIKNPHIGMVSINEVVVNSDYSEARVYVTFFGEGGEKAKLKELKKSEGFVRSRLGEGGEKAKLKELKKSEGFVRSRLASKVDLYKAPKVTFILDETFKKAASLEEALQKEQSDLDKLKGE